MAMAIDTKELLVQRRARLGRRVCREIPLLSEVLWGGLCLLLFMILGPFSAPVALIAIFSLRGEERGAVEPDPLDP